MQEKSQIKPKILQYLKNKGIAKQEFYRKSGIKRGVIEGDSGIQEDQLARFLESYQDVSLEWLFYGVGYYLKGSNNESMVNECSHSYGNSPPNCENCPYKEIYQELLNDRTWYQQRINQLEQELSSQRNNNNSSKQRSA